MAKRGRKKKSEDQPTSVKSFENYFSQKEEDAVVAFLSATSEVERNRIYNDCLKAALEKMTESIINRYRLYSAKMSYKELFDDTLSFLHTKIFMFKPERGKKAYSYFGTIIKRRLLNNRKKETKDKSKVIFYDDVYKVVSRGDDIAEKEYDEDNFLLHFFQVILTDIELLLKEEGELTNDKKVGIAIIEIANNWKSFFEENKTNKFRKNLVLECIRNITFLSTNEITVSLKFYKGLYNKRKKQYIRDLEENF